jgi:diguanylate cyclase (GGDEF)-like protein
MIDVDHFKRVNDRGGHLQGDRVLVAIAQILTDQVRPYDLVGRWGGEEFLVVLPDALPQDAQLVAERVRRTIAESDIAIDGGESIRVQVSAGVAARVPDGSPIDRWIKEADDALYEAKRAGRNQVVMAAQNDVIERSA